MPSSLSSLSSGALGMLIAAVVVLVVGLVFVAIAFGHLIRERDRRIRCGAITEGIVVRLIERRDNDGTRIRRPEVAYDVDGRSFTIRSEAWSVKPGFVVGDRTTVAYDPTDPAVSWLPDDAVSQRRFRIMRDLGLVLIVGAVALGVHAVIG